MTFNGGDSDSAGSGDAVRVGADEERQRLRRQIDEALERIDAGEEPPSSEPDEADPVELAKERAKLENRNRP